MGHAVWLKSIIALVISVLFHFAPAGAQDSSEQNQSSRQGVAAVVVTDGAMVFAKPDSSSALLAQLPEGEKVRVSRTISEGSDDRYRRIRVGNKIGYISVTDVSLGSSGGKAADARPSASGKAAQAPGSRRDKRQKNRDKRIEAMKPKKSRPMYFTRYIGLVFGQSEFKEGISNVNASASLPIYGFKITGPDVLISGPVIDFTLALHSGAPSYYERLSSGKPTGLIVFADALAMVPFVMNTNSLFYVGAGPLLVYSQFGVVNSGRMMDLTAVNLGASFDLAAAIRIDKVALRLEAKYLIEKSSYRSLTASVQSEF